jgi:hypothetical protein
LRKEVVCMNRVMKQQLVALLKAWGFRFDDPNSDIDTHSLRKNITYSNGKAPGTVWVTITEEIDESSRARKLHERG